MAIGECDCPGADVETASEAATLADSSTSASVATSSATSRNFPAWAIRMLASPREQVSVRDLATILEALIDVGAVTKNPVLLVEGARQALSRALVRPLLTPEGSLRVFALDGSLEEELTRAIPGAQQVVLVGHGRSYLTAVVTGEVQRDKGEAALARCNATLGSITCIPVGVPVFLPAAITR